MPIFRKDREALFEEVVNILQRDPFEKQERERFWKLLGMIYLTDSTFHHDVVVPHIMANESVWRPELIELHYPSEVIKAARYAPGALFTLDVSHAGYSDQDLGALAQDDCLAHVVALDLSYNQFGPRGIKALAKSPHLTHLERLNLGSNRFTQKSLDALAKSPLFANLERLELSQCVGFDSILSIATSLPRLRHLDVRHCNLEPDALVQAMESPQLANLEHLDISWTGARDDALIAIARADHFGALTSLRCDRLGAMEPSFTKRGVQELAESKAITGLTHLSLSHCLIGAAEYELLGTAPRFSQLRYLDISYNCYDTNYCLFPLFSSNIRNLEHLDLRGLPLDETDFDSLARSGFCRQLRSLEFDEDTLDAHSAELLATSSSLPETITSRFVDWPT